MLGMVFWQQTKKQTRHLSILQVQQDFFMEQIVLILTAQLVVKWYIVSWC